MQPTQPHICTIGGGSGMPTVNQALVQAGYSNISSIVTTFDSGGDTGRIRTDERGNVLAFSDYWRSLISLWKDGQQRELWLDFLRYRDGRGRNFGNVFFQFMSEKTGSLASVGQLFSSLTGANIQGQVIPIATSPSHVCFSTASGKTYCGEHHLDELRMSSDRVVKIWLTPDVMANPDALDAVRNSDVIILCPGSMFGSVLTNFLPRGMTTAYKSSHAKKILFTNIMSVANENDGYSQLDYQKTLSSFLSVKPLSSIIMSDLNCLPADDLCRVLDFYALEHSHPIKYVPTKDSFPRVKVLDIAQIDVVNFRLRHSVDKLATLFASGQLW